jgi:hypothetical protein
MCVAPEDDESCNAYAEGSRLAWVDVSLWRDTYKSKVMILTTPTAFDNRRDHLVLKITTKCADASVLTRAAGRRLLT